MRINENVRVDKFDDPTEPTKSGAYIEVFERDGKIVGRMNYFDSDWPRGPKVLRAFHKALGAAIELMENDDASESEPVTTEILMDLLGLVMAKSGDTIMAVDLSDVPSADTLEKLTPEQREELAQWASDCHFEASDNDVTAGPLPAYIRDQLPDDHFYKNWRVT